jgi:tRNA/tmRNA/rRNA uracil-C5-methylase (TrmA/RlmC/RlmD family)
MNKNDIITVYIDGCSSEGLGVAHYEGRLFLLRVPSLRSSARKNTKVGSSAVYARLEELIEASPHRIALTAPIITGAGAVTSGM